MDLALEMGRTVEELSAVMSERELSRWASYARRFLLPAKRVQHQLAQVAFAIGKSLGTHKGTDYRAFLIEFEPRPARAAAPVATAAEHAEAMHALAGGGKGVYVLGARRRAREAAHVAG